jgi:hypothetical protein
MHKKNITLGLATMTKNQGGRLKEWINYHYNLGVNKFIIFLDYCSDDSQLILSEIENIDIDIFLTSDIDNSPLESWVLRSHNMYNFVLTKYSNLDWISFIEVDEFIYPQKNIDFKSFLEGLDSECLYINSWDFKGDFDESIPILGQSNLIWTDEQRFNSDYKWRGKSIIKPKNFITCIDAHHFMKNDGKISNQFKIPHNNFIQVNYNKEVTIDDNLFRIYHFRNHTPKSMNNYTSINY